MARSSRTVITVLIVVALVLYAFYSLTGISVVPPKDSPPKGSTFWFFRRGTRLPFVSSPDSQKQKAESASDSSFVPLVPKMDRVLARFPFNRQLYLRTTGGVEMLK